MDELSDDTRGFEPHRRRLFGIAYRMLGSAADADDLVQETFLRWHQADRATIATPEAWLVTTITRLSIDRLRLTNRREAYVGAWLPEPIVADESPGPADRAELASDLSMAFLVLLERLGPEERAAFLMREAFDYDFADIAAALDKSEAACRQLVHRARQRVRAGRPRFTPSRSAREQLLGRFLSAVTNGDADAMTSLLSEEASLTADGGGRVRGAITNVLEGRGRLVRFFVGIERKWGGRVVHRIQPINGEPAIVTYADGRLFCTTSVDTDGQRITAVYRVLNPDKLTRVHPSRLDRIS